jgi:hypothetical protein
VKEAAVAHGVYGRYSRYGKYSAYARTGVAGGAGERRPTKSRKDAPLLVARGTGEDARSWRVTLESQRCYPVMSSCGDRPKEGRSWVATEVVELAADVTA